VESRRTATYLTKSNRDRRVEGPETGGGLRLLREQSRLQRNESDSVPPQKSLFRQSQRDLAPYGSLPPPVGQEPCGSFPPPNDACGKVGRQRVYLHGHFSNGPFRTDRDRFRVNQLPVTTSEFTANEGQACLALRISRTSQGLTLRLPVPLPPVHGSPVCPGGA